MMAVTHALFSLAIAAFSLPLLPGSAPPQAVLTVAFVGGLLPDLDLVAEHRRTLHFPVLGPVLAVGLGAVAVALPAAPVTLAAIAVGMAGLHAASDVFGGSPEPEPWNPTSNRAVFNHALGRWHSPRRYVRYSGAPEDFGFALCFGCVAFLAPGTGPRADAAVGCAVVATALYSLGRRRFASVPRLVASVLPAPLRAVLPTVRVEQTDGGGSTLSIRFR